MLKLALISDTHSQHSKLNLESGDILIHAGDISNRGGRKEIEDFLDWFAAQPYKYKVWIAGNHDFWLEKIKKGSVSYDDWDVLIQKALLGPSNMHYLINSSVTIEGYKIWGSPYTPEFYDWAFMYKRGEGHKHWDLIPNDTDILITHGPMYGYGDRNDRGQLCGCQELRVAIERVMPKLYVFGHIHEDKGVAHLYSIDYDRSCTVINASSINSQYLPYHNPVTYINLPEKNVTFDI